MRLLSYVLPGDATSADSLLQALEESSPRGRSCAGHDTAGIAGRNSTPCMRPGWDGSRCTGTGCRLAPSASRRRSAHGRPPWRATSPRDRRRRSPACRSRTGCRGTPRCALNGHKPQQALCYCGIPNTVWSQPSDLEFMHNSCSVPWPPVACHQLLMNAKTRICTMQPDKTRNLGMPGKPTNATQTAVHYVQ